MVTWSSYRSQEGGLEASAAAQAAPLRERH